MSTERPALEFVLRAAENGGFAPGWDFGPDAGGCQHCPFVAGPAVKSWAQTPDDHEPYGNISNDPSEAHYWCHLPTRLRDGQPVPLDDPWRNQWGEYGPCKMSEWAAQARTELAGIRGSEADLSDLTALFQEAVGATIPPWQPETAYSPYSVVQHNGRTLRYETNDALPGRYSGAEFDDIEAQHWSPYP